MLGAALPAAPALAQDPQRMGVFDAARESLFGDAYASPSTWRSLSAGTFFSEAEAGLYIESPELAAQVMAYMEEGVRSELSYRVRLDADGDLYWVTETDGKTEQYDHDPNSTTWQRTKVRFIRMLPVMNQL
jgi:putative cardiolipin synthase